MSRSGVDDADLARDESWMRRCLELAGRAEGRTAPNPMVGAVIVRRGKLLSEGWHLGPGTAHGEADALARLDGQAPGATLYVNLEPCNHQGRTPPCAPAVLAAGITRVVIGTMDPIRGHRGGARRLARAGVEVVRGVLVDECLALNRPFFTWAKQGRPHIVLKAGVSLDGRVATRTGQSKWITGAAARREVHQLRNQLDAVLVGIGTVLADDPRLDVRDLRGSRNPIRVVVDSTLRTPVDARVLAQGARVIIATTGRAAATRVRRLEAAGAEVWRLPARSGRVDLEALARRLGEAGVTSLLVEGGAEIHAAFLAADLADELRLYMAPIILGGRPAAGGPSWVGGDGIARLTAAHRLVFDGEPQRVGDDLRIVARRA